MCDVLVSKDGIELDTLGDAARYGLDIPAELLASPIHGDARCLCGVDIEPLLEAHPSQWRRGAGMAGFGGRGWSEEDDDGRTWWDGFDLFEPGDDIRIGRIGRSDGRVPLSLDRWETTRAR